MMVLGVLALVSGLILAFAVWKGREGLVFISGGMLLLASVFLLAAWAMSASCQRFERIVGEDTHFDILAGCFVEVDGQFIPVDENSLGLLVAELRKGD